jgi:hypothetical protein
MPHSERMVLYLAAGEPTIPKEAWKLPPFVTICPASHLGLVHHRKFESASNARRHSN